MSWLAALITDYQLYWRRLVLLCFGIVAALALFVSAVLDASGSLTRRDLLSAVFGFLLALYFGRAAFREWVRMKASR